MEEVETFARQHGYTIRPAARQDTYRRPEGHRQDTYRRQEGPRPTTGGARPPRRDKSCILCWHCGKYGHYSGECTGPEKTFCYAPPRNDRPPRDTRINQLDINLVDNQSTHSSEGPEGELNP